jgi:predicted transcriptional regulator
MAEGKLLLLFLIDKVNTPVTNLQLVKFIIKNNLMNYFYFQQYLLELSEDKLLELIPNDGNDVYFLTDKGRQSLSFFANRIPLRPMYQIERLIPQFKRQIRTEISITSDFQQRHENEYMVHCKISESGFTLIDIKIAAGSKEDARSISDNWKSRPEDIYNEITKILLKN